MACRSRSREGLRRRSLRLLEASAVGRDCGRSPKSSVVFPSRNDPVRAGPTSRKDCSISSGHASRTTLLSRGCSRRSSSSASMAPIAHRQNQARPAAGSRPGDSLGIFMASGLTPSDNSSARMLTPRPGFKPSLLASTSASGKSESGWAGKRPTSIRAKDPCSHRAIACRILMGVAASKLAACCRSKAPEIALRTSSIPLTSTASRQYARLWAVPWSCCGSKGAAGDTTRDGGSKGSISEGPTGIRPTSAHARTGGQFTL